MSFSSLFLRLAGKGPAWGGAGKNTPALLAGFFSAARVLRDKILQVQNQGSPLRGERALLPRYEADYATPKGLVTAAERWAAVESEYLASGSNTAANLQDILQRSGFAVQVRENIPTVDYSADLNSSVLRWDSGLAWDGGQTWQSATGDAFLLGSGEMTFVEGFRWNSARVWGDGAVWGAAASTELRDTVAAPQDAIDWRFTILIDNDGEGGKYRVVNARRPFLLLSILKYKPAHVSAVVHLETY